MPDALALDLSDPFSVGTLTTESPRGPYAPGGGDTTCRFEDASKAPLSLGDVVNRALCNNPQTRLAWANARGDAAQVGVARSAYLPSLSATASASRNHSEGGSRVSGATNINGVTTAGATSFNQDSAALSLSYLLYDFGARDAVLETALQTLAASNFAQDATLQNVFLAAVQAYYQLFATRAAVEATLESERVSLESLKAATARYSAGTGTPADKLQAQTAYSQAVLNRIQAEGAAKIAEGSLANVIGEDANRPVSLAAPTTLEPSEQFEKNLDRLIEEARNHRPDLAAAEAQVKAAQANVEAVRASGMPTVSLGANLDYSDTSISSPFHNAAIGISLSIPLFTGFNTTYRVKAAQAQVESQMAQRDNINLQVALDVWQAYYLLETSAQSVRSSADLVASATESANVALGRYKAGAGNIIDLLTAQSSLASARLQRIQALYTWYLAKAALGRAVGRLDLAALDQPLPRLDAPLVIPGPPPPMR